jgi:hypothetical protein
VTATRQYNILAISLLSTIISPSDGIRHGIRAGRSRRRRDADIAIDNVLY